MSNEQIQQLITDYHECEFGLTELIKRTESVVLENVREYIYNHNLKEGFWGTLKRMIEGIYHSISSKYLQRYVDEAVYRWNTRRMSGCDSFRYMFKASIGVVDYKMVKQVA